MTPWVMTQRWNDLLFLHYQVPAEKLRPRVPEVLTLDTYEHRAWVSVTPFWMSQLRPPGIPSLPWISQFAELNVRTYVTFGGKPGVYFFSLDASHLSAVWGARIFYRLPVLARRHEGERAWKSARSSIEANAHTVRDRLSCGLRIGRFRRQVVPTPAPLSTS